MKINHSRLQSVPCLNRIQRTFSCSSTGNCETVSLCDTRVGNFEALTTLGLLTCHIPIYRDLDLESYIYRHCHLILIKVIFGKTVLKSIVVTKCVCHYSFFFFLNYLYLSFL